jgi:hypothetical protein
MSRVRFELPIIIGGDKENSIPEEDFLRLQTGIPTAHGFTSYQESHISSVFKSYFDIKKDYEKKYKKYLSRIKDDEYKFVPELYNNEYEKYIYLRNNIQDLLDDESKYYESVWEKKIIEVILLLFPKYIYVIKNASVRTQDENKLKKFDITLVDFDGNIDLIEIKQPFENCLLRNYEERDNSIPSRELSAAIVQAEKYIYHLNKSGSLGEKRLSEQFLKEYPKIELKIRVTNPKFILILGRDNNLNSIQKRDLEIIKRQYSNVIDMLTYDDLVRRLDNIIKHLEVKIKL